MARLLDRLQAANMSDRGIQTWAQRVCEQIETAFTDLEAQVASIAAAQAAADAAQADADAAQTTANTANSTANTATTNIATVKRDDAISTSWTSPGAILTAADVGSDCTITIAAHTRKYSDATSVSVNGGTITGRAFSTVYYIYYTQTSRAGGAVSYLSTTDPNTAQPNAAAGRHYCGKVTTPADGGASTEGGYTPPGGYGGPGEIP